MERYLGIEEARGKLGRLSEEVAEGGDVVILSKRGRATAALVGRDEYYRFKLNATREARQDLGRALERARKRIADSGLDPSVVDEALSAARRLD